METYANTLFYVVPFFIILLLFEMEYGYWVKKHAYRVMDTVSSLSFGLTNTIRDSLGLMFLAMT
jgi:hypothetical protein